MQRRTFLAASALSTFAQPQKRPNLLFITSDDLGPYLSCYGEKRFSTPNIDKLAASGVRFTTAYVAQASCSPSRSAMLTGLYPHSTGQYGLANAGFALHEPLRANTMPNVLRRAGYKTGIIGKLHVEPESSFQWDYRGTRDAQTRKVKTITPEAEKFIRSAGADPFFLMLNYSDPHAFRNADAPGGWDFPPQIDGIPKDPYPPNPNAVFDFQQIDTPAQRIRTAGYFNAIERLDVGIGDLFAMLEANGKTDNTVVVFCGDHGPPFSRGKTSVYEAALRVPFLLRWPGVTKPNAVSEKMAATVDIMPTLLDAAGVEAPHSFHGKSLRQAVSGGPWRQYLGGEFHWHGSRPFFPRRTVRDGQYQIIHNLLAGRAKPGTGIDGDPAYQVSREPRYDGTPIRKAFDTFANPPEFELYDIKRDRIAFNNLAGDPKHAKVESRMKTALLNWRKETQDPFLDPAFVAKWEKDGAPALANQKQ
jgi:N-sulfoglucosamine sulfohydrolase